MISHNDKQLEKLKMVWILFKINTYIYIYIFYNTTSPSSTTSKPFIGSFLKKSVNILDSSKHLCVLLFNMAASVNQ